MSQSVEPPRTRPTVPTSRWSRDQWDQFVGTHSKPLLTVIARQAKLQPHDQDDTFGETLLGLAETIADRRQPSAPFPFVSGIAINKTRSKVRQLAGARRRADQRLAVNLEDPAGHGLAVLEADERCDAVRDYLARLNPTDRKILVARGVEDLTWDQVSARVGLSKTTVLRRYEVVVLHAQLHLTALAP